MITDVEDTRIGDEHLPLASSHQLFPRKGGGGGGGHGGGRGSASRGGSKGGGKSGKGSDSGKSTSVTVGGKTLTARAKSPGGGHVIVLYGPAHHAYGGGGTRDQVFGGRWYGSGFYDSNDTPGIFGRNLTFVFWPIAWPVAFVPFLLAPELGPASNANRPGGVLMSLQIPSSKGPDTFRVVSDEFTVDSLSDSVQENCKDLIGTLSSAVNISDTVPQKFPRAEQVLFYYRASSVALTWDSLNDTAAMLQNYTVASAPGPSVDTDAYKLVECLNRTIVDAVPLFDSAFTKYQAPGGMTLALILVVMHLLH